AEVNDRDDDTNKYWNIRNTNRTPFTYTNRASGVSIENVYLSSQIDALQWQLKEVESSRGIYRTVMKQLVTFLEKAHRSLELLDSKLNNDRLPNREEDCCSSYNGELNDSSSWIGKTCTDSADVTYRNVSRRAKRNSLPHEISPHSLSQEAYRLLRTAESLLNTQEPDLTNLKSNQSKDLEFLAQLAKEFPAEPSVRKQISLNPKLLTPEKESKPTPSKITTSDIFRETLSRSTVLSSKSSIANDADFSSTLTDGHSLSFKTNSSPVSSIGSAEDESGFSSLNSFQEVGLPMTNDPKKHRLYETETSTENDNFRLWKTTTTMTTTDQLSLSTRGETTKSEKILMNVLWV
ncbi:PREDICTED: uncharacterized protein LOC108569351, partial [Nicrophorus vespilloides]|uniref:Uncharacterized protein LOC108569351 n=1 Tax=Nicrophorus vespilloides TaxID=110193 RepID=A0ABM1NHR2_NICVS